ncbi:hypothetical protein HID58_047702, partial [Brassica napus]
FWDPGIIEEAGRSESEVRIGNEIFQDRKIGNGISRFYLKLGSEDMIEGTRKMEIWIWRQLRSMRIFILILITIKMKSNQDEGIIFLSVNLINPRFRDTERFRTEDYKESCNVTTREKGDWRRRLRLMGFLRELDLINMNQRGYRAIKEIWGSRGMRHGAREEAREEGEIRSVEECRNTLPSQAFQVDLAKTQAEGSKVISDPIDVDQGLAVEDQVGLEQEDQVDLEEEDVMDMDEIKAHLLENEIDMDAEDFMEKLSEEEIDEEGKEQEDESNAQDTDEVVVVDDVQGKLGGDAVKKHGLRKRLFKSSSRTVGSTKMRVELQQSQEHDREIPVSMWRVRVFPTRNLGIRGQGLSYVSFCLLVLISSTSICIFLVSKSSKRLVLLALLWLMVRFFFEVKKWNNKTIFCYWFGCLIMVLCLCLRFEYIYGCVSGIWDIGIVGMARNTRYSSLGVGRNSPEIVFLLLAFVIMDYPIASVFCCWGRVSSIYIIYVPCSGKCWCIRYGAADFFVKNSLRGVDWPFIYDMVREVFGSLVSLNQDQSQLRWKGLYCYIYAMRGDGFLPHQGDSGDWYFGQINWLEKEIDSDDRVFCSRHIVCDFGRILDRFALTWRLNVKNRFVFVASFWLFFGMVKLTKKGRYLGCENR